MIHAIASAACVDAPRAAETIARAMSPHADESPAVLHVVAARLFDVTCHRLPINADVTARCVEQARAFVAEGGRVALAGRVIQ